MRTLASLEAGETATVERTIGQLWFGTYLDKESSRPVGRIEAETSVRVLDVFSVPLTHGTHSNRMDNNMAEVMLLDVDGREMQLYRVQAARVLILAL